MKTNKNNHFKERRVSLQETMNHMARRMEGLLDEADQKKERPARPEPQAEAEDARLWAAVDPLLADLQKHLADAKANMLSLQKKHGAKDPMAEIAGDIADSAASAVETRMIELRHSAEKKEALKALIIKEMDEKFFAEREEERLHSKKFWAEFARPKGRREAAIKRVADDSFLMVAASLMILQHNLDRAQKTLSIAAKFAAASANDRLTSDRRLAGSV
jgi:hydrogenase maturation factor HypF (carbamoyltransferase family)